MGEGEGFICSSMCGVNIVQNVSTSCVEADVTMELWKHALRVCMVEISSQDEESIRVACLLLTDMLIKFIQSLPPVGGRAGRDVYCYQQYGIKFPRQVEWPAFNNHKLCQR